MYRSTTPADLEMSLSLTKLYSGYLQKTWRVSSVRLQEFEVKGAGEGGGGGLKCGEVLMKSWMKS